LKEFAMNKSTKTGQHAENPRMLPPGKEGRNSGEPGGGQGRVDVTGVAPDDIGVDPNITEGHPGYDESGNSGIPGRKPPR
jgi:hypothetical protein